MEADKTDESDLRVELQVIQLLCKVKFAIKQIKSTPGLL